MSAVLEAAQLTKAYGKKKALSGCDLSIPSGHVVGLVGPNGAGKTTLLHLAVGLLAPTSGRIEILGRPPAADEEALKQVGFVAQESPVYGSLKVREHLDLGEWLNRNWDGAFARDRLAAHGLDPAQRAGTLSGGQRAQLALTMAIAKQPSLLVLDEPVAALDPLARREFLQELMTAVAERGVDVLLSSHLVSDIERVCDWVIVLCDSRVRLSGDITELLAEHRRLVGPLHESPLPENQEIVTESHTDRQSTYVVRSRGAMIDPSLSEEPLGLEDLVLAYMSEGRGAARSAPVRLEVAR